jgi:hypothetical protein
MKTVFTNSQVAHVWAQQNQATGRSGNGQFYFEGATIFSYGGHFPIARFVEANGSRVVLFTAADYSVTTGRHKSYVRGALHGLDVPCLSVPDLRHWRNDESSHKTVLSAAVAHIGSAELDLAKHQGEADDWRANYSRERAVETRANWQAYSKAFCPKLRLPKNCAAVVADRRAKAARERFADKIAEARSFADSSADRLAEFLPVPAFRDVSTYNLEQRERALTRFGDSGRKARYWLAKGKAARPLRDKLATRLKQGAAALADYQSLIARQEAAEAFDADKATLDAIRAHIRQGAELPREFRAFTITTREFNGRRIPSRRETNWQFPAAVEALWNRYRADSAFGDYGDCFAFLWRELSRAEALKAFDRENPQSYRTTADRNRRSAAELREAWLNGETVVLPHSGSSYEATLVRKRGSQLETSRGASAPFNQAAAIFAKAQSCRAKGQSWARNGERYPAGSFELDRIDSSGSIRIGCHAIAFDEMQRLAIRETPQLVRPRFPLPVPVAA